MIYTESVTGTPIDIEKLFTYNGRPLVPLFGKDPFPQKLPEVWSVYHLMAIRRAAKYAFNNNSNVHGLMTGLRCYVVGAGYTVAAVPKDDGGDPEELQEYLDEFAEANDLDGEAHAEEFIRTHIEGESLVRFYPQPSEVPQVRFIEPDMLLPPPGEIFDGIPEQAPWSYGILCQNHDFQTPIAYNIRWPDNTDELVSAELMCHAKVNVMRNIKRGISSLLPSLQELEISKKLRWAAAIGEASRQAIAYFRKHSKADKNTVLGMQSEYETDTITRFNSEGAQYDVSVERKEPGTVEDISAGFDVESPPQSDSSVLEAVHKMCLQAVAARFQAPSWLVDGASDAASYSSAVVSESPFYKRLSFEQDRRTGFWRKVYRKAIEIGIESGRLSPDTLDRFDVVVNAPSPVVRNTKDLNEVYKTLYTNGGLSLTTWMNLNEFDLKDELEHKKEEKSMGIEPVADPDAKLGSEPETMNGQRQQDTGDPE